MFDTGDDFTVDVLVIGAGAQGRYVANALAADFSVCVLADPSVGRSTLDTPGLLSAGYTGNDAVRMQAARRTAGYWRHWAETSATAGASTPTFVTLTGPAVSTATRLWDDAGLEYRPADLPRVFGDGPLARVGTTFRVNDDVVVDPGELLGFLTPPEVPFVEGKVVKIGVDADSVIDHVDIETARGVMSIAPRFVVLAAGVGNAGLLAAIARRLRDQDRRRAAVLEARDSQVVVDHHVVALRSAQLPVLAGSFDDLTVVAHQVTGSPDVVWLVTDHAVHPPIAPGESNLRFDPPVVTERLQTIIGRLRSISPLIDQKSQDFEWAAYVTREAVHPSAADLGTQRVGTPLPARLDAFGLESFLALWPSHLGYTMLVGDVVAERVAASLGESAGPVDLRLRAVASEVSTARSRWWSPSFLWHDWRTFAAIQGLPAH